jgi:hypothetical protein
MMEKGIPTFEALRDRATAFRSKNFSVVHLHEGISALPLKGLRIGAFESKRLPCAREHTIFPDLVNCAKMY